MRTMDAAAQAGVQRYVMASHFGSPKEHGIDLAHSFWTYAEAKAVARVITAARVLEAA